MLRYKIVWDDGEEEDELFITEREADEYAVYLQGCAREGAEILNMSNPGDYDYDEDNYEYPEYEIVEVEVEDNADNLSDLSEQERRQALIMNSPGLFDDEGEWVRCPICGMGLHDYNGTPTCPDCDS